MFGARTDLAVFGGSALASLALLLLGAQLGVLQSDAPPWLWLAGVVLIDVAHVWSTTLRVYLDKREVLRRPALYLGLPCICYVIGLFAHAVSSRVFWTLLAYTAVFHFVRQQWGWVALFHRRNPWTSRFDRALDTVAIYLATLYPLAHWHAHLPRRFHWLIEGDFLLIPALSAPLIAEVAPLYVTVLALFCARQAQLALQASFDPSKALFVPGKALVVVSTFACWYLGIVAFDSDYAFTATNVLIHGVPYFALTYRYARMRTDQPAPAPALARVLKLGALGVVALFGLIALGEELLWERFVWSDHPLGQLALVFVVPLLALPQAVHYALDGFVWKRSAFAAQHGVLLLVLALAASVVACDDGNDEGAPGGTGGVGGYAGSAGGPAPNGGVQASGGSGGSGGSAGVGQAGAGAPGGGQAGSGGRPADDAGLDASMMIDAGGTAGTPAPQDLPEALTNAGVVALFPAPRSDDQCPDPSLHIVFSDPPALGSSGKIQVFDAAQPGVVVASIDLAVGSTNDTIGGVMFSSQRAAYVDGNAVTVYVRPRMLSRGHAYYVHVETGAITGPSGTPISITDDATWTFSTAALAPRDSASLRVTSDGTGDFCTPQAAIDATGAGPSTIELASGTYHGIVYFRDKAQLTLRGEDRKETRLIGTNNENMNGGTAKRALIGVDTSSEIAFERLTIQNLTPQGGSQAEALRMQRCDKCSVRDADIISLQDTLLWSGRVYAENCYIAGNVDFIWGTGTAYFDNCEIKTLGRKGYNVQARNAAGAYGYVFVDSRLTSDPGITGNWLARVDSSVYPASHVAYIDCELGSHIDAAGWQVTGGGTSSLRFWEYQSKAPGGALINVSQRLAGSKQLSSAEAAQMRDPSLVLGGWDPN